MRYNDEQLFNLDNKSLNELKSQLRFNEFCAWAVDKLNYRIKAVRFYEQKKGKQLVRKQLMAL